MVFVTTIAVNIETNTPIAKVRANPRTIPDDGKKFQLRGLYKINAVISVVKLASLIESQALPKPNSMAIFQGLPFLSSSVVLANIKILLSKAIPIDRINPI